MSSRLDRSVTVHAPGGRPGDEVIARAAVVDIDDGALVLRTETAIPDTSVAAGQLVLTVDDGPRTIVDTTKAAGRLLWVTSRARIRHEDHGGRALGKLVAQVDDAVVVGEIENISCHGIGFRTTHRFAPGDRVAATVHLNRPAAASIDAELEVRWGRGRTSGRPGHFGGQWSDLSDEAQRVVTAWVFDRLTGVVPGGTLTNVANSASLASA